MNKNFKKSLLLVLVLIIAVYVVGCWNSIHKGLVMERDIASIEVYTEPKSVNYIFTEMKEIQTIVDYLDSLHLKAYYWENPRDYCGMTWIIKIKYSDSREQVIYHFGNMFIRSNNDWWYKMSYEEASNFAVVLSKLVPLNLGFFGP